VGSTIEAAAAPPPKASRPVWVRTVHRFARALTPDEFLALPPAAYGAAGPGKLELVDGEVIEMPPVMGDHTDVADDLHRLLAAYVAAHGGETLGRVRQELSYRLVLPPDHARPDQVREPDVSFVTTEALRRLPPAAGGPVAPGHRLPRAFLRVAPALAAEVLSDHDYEDMGAFMEKLEDYLAAGVSLIWVLSPRDDAVTVYDQATGLAAPRVLRKREGGELDGGTVLPGFRVPLSAVFRPV
jgi:Uma2 family endonuclease